MGRDERIYEEAAALWRELFDESPPIKADGSTMLAVITRSLPDMRYDRLRARHLRSADVTFPRGH